MAQGERLPGTKREYLTHVEKGAEHERSTPYLCRIACSPIPKSKITHGH